MTEMIVEAVHMDITYVTNTPINIVVQIKIKFHNIILKVEQNWND